MKLKDAPRSNEIEISLFGPQFGEALVVHYGDGKWLTIDSCLEKDAVTPAALAYFEAISVNPASVTHTILTHSDADHIGGIERLYTECVNSRLVCTTLLAQKDFLTYLAVASRKDPADPSPPERELVETIRASLGRKPFNGPMYVKQDTLVLRSGSTQLVALAPSDSRTHSFLLRIAQLTERIKMDPIRPGPLTPNSISAAMLFEAKGVVAVFGADLEETPGRGWSTVLANSVAMGSAGPATVFKVAHHGSSNADHKPLWDSMSDPIAILAPFNYGKHKIPKPDDVSRILGYTSQAFSTSALTADFKRVARVDKVLNRVGIARKDLFPKSGHVRIRIDAAGNRDVALFDGAMHLSKVH